jgi:hypothetical protein
MQANLLDYDDMADFKRYKPSARRVARKAKILLREGFTLDEALDKACRFLKPIRSLRP